MLCGAKRGRADPADRQPRLVEPRRVDAFARPAQQVGDREHAADGDAAQRSECEQRGRLHLDRPRPLRMPLGEAGLPDLVEQVARDDRRGRGVRRAAAQRREQAGIRVDPLAGAERPAGSVGADRLGHEQQIAQAERVVERARRADADRPRRAERDQFLEHDRGGGSADAGALNRQQLTVGRSAGVAPEAAVVVEHARLVKQFLGEGERTARVAGEQDARRERRGRVQMDGGGRVAQGERLSRSANLWR